MKTLNEFFKVYKNELPFTYKIFICNYKNNELIKRMVNEKLIFVSGNKRTHIKVLDDEKFKEFLFSLGMGGVE